MRLTRRSVLAAPALLPFAARAAAEPVFAGVSGPLTGPNAQYGAQWKRGFDLALDGINAAGGAKGRPLQYIFEDSQSDPRQSVALAQKFAADPRIIIELGDFSSPASMAASPIYQRAKLVQFGFTNSHPDFTKGGDHMWSNSTSQAEEQPKLYDFAAALGLRRPAVLHLNTDWGRTAKDAFVAAAKAGGAQVAAVEAYLPNEQDFRPTLVRVQDARPDGLVLLSYYADGALICRQARDAGLTLPILAGTSNYSPKFLELGGTGVEGVFVMTTFFPADPRPAVQDFVRRYRAKYDADPDSFAAGAFDTMVLWGRLVEGWGPSREGMQAGLLAVRDVPSVIYGSVTFDPQTRRVQGASYKRLVVRHGQFGVWDGARPA